MPKRATIYCRVSSPGQKDNGSLEEQESRGRNWCREHGYQIQSVHHEIFSGEELERPQLEAMMSEVKAGAVEVIVADKVDRFSRADPAITAYIMIEAEQYGATIEFVEVQDDSFEGQILRAVLSIVARVEHKRIKERVNAGKRRRVLGDPTKDKPAKLLPGNIPRYGWQYADTEKSRYIHEPHQAAIMLRIYIELGEQSKSLTQICKDLEAEGELPPTAAQAALGHNTGARRRSSHWLASSVATMLKQPCYWGEAVAYRYEAFQRQVRDPQTRRIRKKKSTRYRDPESATLVRYDNDIWPGIVSKELAMKAIARLEQNRVMAVRNLRHVDSSYLRAGFIKCGYCGGNMVLHTNSYGPGHEPIVRFICGQNRAFKMRRPNAAECPQLGQFGIRAESVEPAVWNYLLTALSDPELVPSAYERLTAREAGVTQQRDQRVARLDKLINEATTRRSNFLASLGQTDDPALRQLILAQASEIGAHIGTWDAERERITSEAASDLADTATVRSFVAELNSRMVHMLTAGIAEKRQLLEALGVRVFAWELGHEPWFVVVSDLPGVAASWHGKHQQRKERIAILDEFPTIPEECTRDAVTKWTAPVPKAEKPATSEHVHATQKQALEEAKA